VPRPGDRIAYRCLYCDGEANATYKLTRYGDYEWIIGCWTIGCEGQHLPSLADALGLDAAADKDRIAGALRRHGQKRRRREPEPLPSIGSIEGWHVRLLALAGPLAYLAERGVSGPPVRAHRIGWDGKRLTFPMFDAAGELVAFKTRLPKSGAQMMAPAGSGRPWPLYPPVDRRKGWTLLTAGELDALAARAARLPASSVTLGAGHWRDEWTGELAGQRVVVCFDNNEEQQARERVDGLKAAGIPARRLDLRTLGLDTAKGDLSDFLNGGGSLDRLHRAARPRIVRRGARRAA